MRSVMTDKFELPVETLNSKDPGLSSICDSSSCTSWSRVESRCLT